MSKCDNLYMFQFDAEFRRFSVDRGREKKFDDFQGVIERIHFLQNIPFIITYTDVHGDLLPINNDDNMHLALFTAKPVLRILVQRKGNYSSLDISQQQGLCSQNHYFVIDMNLDSILMTCYINFLHVHV